MRYNSSLCSRFPFEKREPHFPEWVILQEVPDGRGSTTCSAVPVVVPEVKASSLVLDALVSAGVNIASTASVNTGVTNSTFNKEISAQSFLRGISQPVETPKVPETTPVE